MSVPDALRKTVHYLSKKLGKRRLRLATFGLLVLYLGLGPLSLREGRSAEGRGLPMSSWPLSEVEKQSVLALEVVAKRTPQRAPVRFLPDLKPARPKDVYTVGSRAGGDLRLKFDTTIWNAGLGPLETRGAKNPTTGRLEVYQYIYQGAPQGRRALQGSRVGTFDYNHRHGHLHFDDFAHYELWSLGARGERQTLVADNAKVGFCLMDIKDMESGRTHLQSGRMGKPGGPVYAGCRADIQGVSVGWGDEYLALLYEQDLDLTGVPDGDYALLIKTNPAGRLEELDYRNNTVTVEVRLEADSVTTFPQPVRAASASVRPAGSESFSSARPLPRVRN